jgi:two-component system, NarL family, response regulator LiaR
LEVFLLCVSLRTKIAKVEVSLSKCAFNLKLLLMEKIMNRVSIVLIEDHHLTRVGIKAALEDCEEIKFIAEASNGLQGITILEKTLPDVAIIDLGLPGLVDGIELTKRFKEYVQTCQLDSSISQPKVLILTSQAQEESILAAFAAGADSYCMKDLKFEKLLEAILETHRGANWIDPSIARIVLARLNNPFKAVVGSSVIPTVSIHGLKPEDNELLQYLCKHRSLWYAQEKRPLSPFLCTYVGRQDTGRGRHELIYSQSFKDDSYQCLLDVVS